MKKNSVLAVTIVSIGFTFIIAKIFSLYNFGDNLTFLTFCYLISLFTIFEYILLSFIYIVKKILNKENIKVKEIIGIILFFIALILILLLILVLNIDWLNWYSYSIPFYINVIIKCFKYLIPSIVLILISIFLIRKNR